jgi:hypothetical protein
MDDFEKYDDKIFYIINYDKIISDKKYLSVTKLLAAIMMKNPYITVGDFLKNISDNDLEHLIEISDTIDEGNTIEDFILLSGMLAAGEGLEFWADVGVVHKRVNQFLVLLSLESLYRKRMIKLYRENMTFGEDMNDKVVAEKLDDEFDE